MKRKNLAIMFLTVLIIIIIIIGIFLYSNLVDYFLIIEKKEIYSNLIVSDKYGFDINSTALIFGSVMPGGGTSSREIYLKNTYNQNVRVRIFIKGKIKDFVKVSENDFLLETGKTKTINFQVSSPKTTPYGMYEGKVIIFIRNPLVN